MLTDGADVGVGGAAGGEDVGGGLCGDRFDFAQRFVAVGACSSGVGFGAGDALFRGFGCRGGVFGGSFGAHSVLVGGAAGLFGVGGGHLGFGDAAGGVGLDLLDLRFGHRRVGERGEFGDRGVEGGAQLLCQATELFEQLIGAHAGRRRRTRLRHSDGTRRGYRLLLLPLTFPPCPPPRVFGKVAVFRRSPRSPALGDRSRTAREVAYVRHPQIVAFVSLAVT
ncbi:hypothetical protein [Nocardia cyriacigeorgica]|uniref:hypothetical protein n=1 Tax=Nocardia cyriacigeorgica TaxID=135487 RepID=UPI0024569885|nr:hypothetical protein [Nocardia cyriacigeorgica]